MNYLFINNNIKMLYFKLFNSEIKKYYYINYFNINDPYNNDKIILPILIRSNS